MKQYYLLFILVAFSPLLCHGQSPSLEVLSQQREGLDKVHEEDYGDIKYLISGRQHRAVFHFTVGHPFWKQKSWFLGNLQTDLHYYPNLTLRYDIHKDLLLYLPDSLSVDYIAVNQDQVKYFELEGHVFHNMGSGKEKVAMEQIGMKEGYYETIWQGTKGLILFAKNSKELKGKTGDTRNHSEFYDRRKRYLFRDDTFYLIKRKKHLLGALDDHKDQVKVFMRKRNMNVKRMNDFSFIQLLSYYDTL